MPDTRHPLADRDDIPLVHVTHFNRLFWDNGRAPTTVIEHGIVDPGERWTGELARAAVVVNEPVRRGRIIGTDLLPALRRGRPGRRLRHGAHRAARALRARPGRRGLYDDPPQAAMHAELARRRVYVHPCRWTSLGLSLLEAMHLGHAGGRAGHHRGGRGGAARRRRAVDPAGRLLVTPSAAFLHDEDAARLAGKAARAAALDRYGLARFLADWDRLLEEVTR